jgi:hypothetical protein
MSNKDTLLLIFIVVIIVFVVAGFIFVNHNNKTVLENFQSQTEPPFPTEPSPSPPTLDQIIKCINKEDYHYNLIEAIGGINNYQCINKKYNPVYFASNVLTIKDNTVITNENKEQLNTMEVFDEDFKSILSNTVSNNILSLLTLPDNIKNKNPNWSIQIITVTDSNLKNSVINSTTIQYDSKNKIFNVNDSNDNPTKFVIMATKNNEEDNTTTAAGTTAAGTTAAGTDVGTTSAGTTSAGTTSAGTTSAGTTSAGTTSAGTTSASIPIITEPFSNMTKNTGVQGVTPDIGGSPF